MTATRTQRAKRPIHGTIVEGYILTGLWVLQGAVCLLIPHLVAASFMVAVCVLFGVHALRKTLLLKRVLAWSDYSCQLRDAATTGCRPNAAQLAQLDHLHRKLPKRYR